MKNLKNISAISLTTFSFLSLASGVFAAGNAAENACPTTVGAALCNLSIGKAIGGIVSFMFIIAAIIALIYLIYGGIRWVTSGGDKSNVEAARDQIIAAIIGLVIVFLSYVILNVVLQFFFGFSLISNFQIPTISTTTGN